MDIQPFFYFLQQNILFFYIISAVLGVMIGSFLNVVIIRYPKQLYWQWQQEARSFLEIDEEDTPKPPGIVKKSSHCPLCGHTIQWWENIPVVSYIFLRGQCRGCKAKISLQYPLVELITSLLFLGAAFSFGMTEMWVASVFAISLLIAASVIDLKTMILPDIMMYLLLWSGLLVSVLGWGLVTPQESLIGAMVGYLSLWSVYWGFKLLTGKDGMGFGDFKLLAALGAWVGGISILPIVMVAAITGGVLGIIQMKKTKSSQPFPFGPFLAIGGLIELLSHQKMAQWIIGGAL